MLNKKKIIAILSTGILVLICGVLIFFSINSNRIPVVDYTPPSKIETVITEQQEPSQDKDVYFEPDGPPIVHEEPTINWEEPPVVTVYNPEADLNNDGHVDKEEWEIWIKNNPEDLNQDLYITEEEQAEFNKPAEHSKPAEQTKPAEQNTPSQSTNNNNQGNTKPVDKPTPPASSNSNNGMTQKEIDAAKKMSEDAINDILNWADSQGGGTMTKEQAEKGFDQ